MEPRIVRAGALALVLVASVVQAQQPKPSPLAPDVLARCAAQVQSLRDESARLVQTNTSYEVRRNAINERSATLKAERDNLKPDDLKADLALRQALQEHTAQTVAFNADVEKLKAEIRAVNVVKKDYDGGCANRPYRRQDLDAMPEAAQNAMRNGLGGVQVPYIAP